LESSRLYAQRGRKNQNKGCLMNARARELLVVSVCMAAFALEAAEEWKLPPETAVLKPGTGADLVTAQCLICHSAEYISTQPRMNRAAWTASVQKMREKFGAPIATNTVDRLVEYLVTAYGPEQKP
jgi:sulfite dehydrogenase (cytochrome) subunit B